MLLNLSLVLYLFTKMKRQINSYLFLKRVMFTIIPKFKEMFRVSLSVEKKVEYSLKYILKILHEKFLYF